MKQEYSKKTKELLRKADIQKYRNIKNLEELRLATNELEAMHIEGEAILIVDRHMDKRKKNY